MFFTRAATRAPLSVEKSGMRSTETALESYYIDNNIYPGKLAREAHEENEGQEGFSPCLRGEFLLLKTIGDTETRKRGAQASPLPFMRFMVKNRLFSSHNISEPPLTPSSPSLSG